MTDWPITFRDVLDARRIIRQHLAPTPLRRYAELDEAVGHAITVFVKHENHNPTNAFKARNALSAMSRLSPERLARGVAAATRGNHGQGLAWAGRIVGAPVTIFVPEGNNPEKNAAPRAPLGEARRHRHFRRQHRRRDPGARAGRRLISPRQGDPSGLGQAPTAARTAVISVSILKGLWTNSTLSDGGRHAVASISP